MRAHASGAFVCRPSHTRAFSPLSLSSYAAQNWIEEMTGCNLNEGTFADSLKNGIILCKCVRRSLARLARLARLRKNNRKTHVASRRRLANKIKPGSVAKINEPVRCVRQCLLFCRSASPPLMRRHTRLAAQSLAVLCRRRCRSRRWRTLPTT
jgi:hypothetical protein